MKNVILCADDYGQNPAISQAIIELIQKKRLSATSCMVNSPYWPRHAKGLLPFKRQVDIGLHINFTTGQALSSQFVKHYGTELFSLGRILLKSHLRWLNKGVIRAEVEAQLDSFNDAMQQYPNFIDGHQHIHQFPVLRDIILEVYEKRLRAHGSYMRSVTSSWNESPFKSFIIQITGANKLKNQLIKRSIPHNVSFEGIYNFSQASQYHKKFLHFLELAKDNTLIMCHPGHGLDTDYDPIYPSRQLEYQYLASEQFLADCAQWQVSIGRFK